MVMVKIAEAKRAVANFCFFMSLSFGADSGAGEKEVEGLVSRANSQGAGGKKAGNLLPKHPLEFHACGG
jgi:hypothetical protein